MLDALTVIAVICAVTSVTVSLHGRDPQAAVAVRDTVPIRVTDWAELTSHGRRIGPAAAALTVVGFGDFQCPACGAFERSWRAFRAAHPGQVALIFRHWPLQYHNLAYPAARASECAAAANRFAEFHDMVYQKQDSLGLLSFTEFARRAGIADLEDFERCVADTTKVLRIADDIAAVRKLGGHGTPTVIVNGVMLGHVPDSARLESIWKASMARADQQ